VSRQAFAATRLPVIFECYTCRGLEHSADTQGRAARRNQNVNVPKFRHLQDVDVISTKVHLCVIRDYMEAHCEVTGRYQLQYEISQAGGTAAINQVTHI